MELLSHFEQIKYDIFRRRQALSIPAKITLAVGFAVLTGLLAQVKFSLLPFSPVPVTLQTFAVLMAGITLGRWWGGGSMALYVGLGIAGVPWFAGGVAGFGSTFGYLIGFIMAALLIGHIADRYAVSRTIPRMFGLMGLATLLLIYVPGVIWLYLWLGIVGQTPTITSVIAMGVAPFLAGDLVKTAAAATLARVITPGRDYLS